MIKRCGWCGSEFEQTHGNQKYCSRYCYSLANRELRRKRFGYAKNHEPRFCSCCGKPFIPTHGNQKYCSNECYQNSLRRHLSPSDRCCNEHGGIDNCPYPDCVME